MAHRRAVEEQEERLPDDGQGRPRSRVLRGNIPGPRPSEGTWGNKNFNTSYGMQLKLFNNCFIIKKIFV